MIYIKNSVVKDLYNLLNNEIYKDLFDDVLSCKNIYSSIYFKSLNNEEVLDLFNSYIIYEYINLNNEDEMLVFLKALQSRIIVESVAFDFMNLLESCSKTDVDIKRELINDVNELKDLRSYATNENYELLNRFNNILVSMIQNDEKIMKYKYKLDLSRLIMFIKCEIVKEMINSENPYAIIKLLENSEEELEFIIINVFNIYINKTQTFNERKLVTKINIDKFTNILSIFKDLGYSR